MNGLGLNQERNRAMSKTADSTSELTLESLDAFINARPAHRARPTTLVAPNKEVAEQWAEMYPGVQIVMGASPTNPHEERKES